MIPYHIFGHIAEYGIGFTDEEKKDLLPIGTRVILDYKKHEEIYKIRLMLDQEQFYVYKPDEILAFFTEDEEE